MAPRKKRSPYRIPMTYDGLPLRQYADQNIMYVNGNGHICPQCVADHLNLCTGGDHWWQVYKHVAVTDPTQCANCGSMINPITPRPHD